MVGEFLQIEPPDACTNERNLIVFQIMAYHIMPFSAIIDKERKCQIVKVPERSFAFHVSFGCFFI